MKTATITDIPQELMAAKQAAVTTTAPVLAQVQSVMITDQDSYLTADVVLARIRQARGCVETRFERLITPAYNALQEIYKLKREMMGPLDEGEKAIKEKMKGFKLEEARLEAERKEAESKLRREAEEKTRAVERAKTAQMRARLVAEAMAKQAEVNRAADVIITPIRAVGSTTRTVPKVTVTSVLDLLRGVVAGDVPMDVVMPNFPVISAYLKDDRAAVEAWKGVKVWDDITIVGR